MGRVKGRGKWRTARYKAKKSIVKGERRAEEKEVQWGKWRRGEYSGWSGGKGKWRRVDGVEWGEEGKRIELLILCIIYRYRLRTNAHVS